MKDFAHVKCVMITRYTIEHDASDIILHYRSTQSRSKGGLILEAFNLKSKPLISTMAKLYFKHPNLIYAALL